MRLLGRLLRTCPTSSDRLALALLVALPVLINLPFALAGHPLMGGDNLTQNFPLRVLSGELLRHGQLPLWNPDIWSGTPLLAGWNAGAMFPGTWLFAVLPGVAAWELNVIAVGVIGGVGLFVFCRREGCSPVASLLASLTFAYTGFMSGQSVHLGLVMGMAIAPWMLVAVDQIARSESWPRLRRPAAFLGLLGALVVLAGDPRAASNDALIVVAYVLAQCWRARRSLHAIWRLLAGAVGGGLLATALSAVQWLPGLAFLGQSQRPGASLSYFGSYSLSGGEALGYLLSPFVFGGNGSLGLPTTNFNLPEFTYSVGLMPLVALFVLSVREATRRWRARQGGRPVGVWLAMSAVGIVLSLGTNTPLSRLLVHVPLYGGERLQNRNMAIADLALCVLLAIFLDTLRPPAAADPAGLTAPLLTRAERLAGAIPPLAVVALLAAMLLATARTERFLGATTLALGLPDRMAPYYGFAAAVALLALLAVVRERWRRPRWRFGLASGVVALDVVMFLAMASYQPAPSGSLAEQNTPIAALVRAAGGSTGRSAILNPLQLPVDAPAHVITDLGLDDLIVLRHLDSVQGYGSAVSSAYEAATGAHAVENLLPSALLTSTFDVLDLRVLATVPELFGTPRASLRDVRLATGPAEPPVTSRADLEPGNTVDFGPLPPAGPWRIVPGQMTELGLPGPLAIDQVALRVSGPPRTTRLRLVVALRSGARVDSTVSVRGPLTVVAVPRTRVIAGGGATAVEVSAPAAVASSVSTRTGASPGAPGAATVLRAVAVHVAPWTGSVPIVSSPGRSARVWFQLDGPLQGLVPSSRWTYEGNVGAIDLYRNTAAFGPAWLEPAGSSSAVTPSRSVGTVVQPERAEWQDPVDDVDTPHGALLVRSEAYAPGWSVTVTVTARSGAVDPRRARSAPIAPAVRRVGLVQGVLLPPGDWVVTWHYRSARADLGLIAGAAGVLVFVLLVVQRRPVSRRRRRTADAALQPPPV